MSDLQRVRRKRRGALVLGLSMVLVMAVPLGAVANTPAASTQAGLAEGTHMEDGVAWGGWNALATPWSHSCDWTGTSKPANAWIRHLSIKLWPSPEGAAGPLLEDRGDLRLCGTWSQTWNEGCVATGIGRADMDSGRIIYIDEVRLNAFDLSHATFPTLEGTYHDSTGVSGQILGQSWDSWHIPCGGGARTVTGVLEFIPSL